MKAVTSIVACAISLLWVGCKPSAPATTKDDANSVASTYTDAMFWKALDNNSTAPYFLLATIRDAGTGVSRRVCVVAPFLQGAMHKELGMDYSEANERKVLSLILSAPSHVYTFSNPAALANVAPRYTPAELEAVRQRLAPYTQAQLHDPKTLESVQNGPSHENYDAYRDAIAHVMLERGILCGQSDIVGNLYLAP